MKYFYQQNIKKKNQAPKWINKKRAKTQVRIINLGKETL